MRVANQLISSALPFLPVTLPEEKMDRLYFGSDDNIDIIKENLDPLTNPSSSSSSLSLSLDFPDEAGADKGDGKGANNKDRDNDDDTTPPSPGRMIRQFSTASQISSSKSQTQKDLRDIMVPTSYWRPSCGARRLRSLRRLLFTHTKLVLWEMVLDATATTINLQHDE